MVNVIGRRNDKKDVYKKIKYEVSSFKKPDSNEKRRDYHASSLIPSSMNKRRAAIIKEAIKRVMTGEKRMSPP